MPLPFRRPPVTLKIPAELHGTLSQLIEGTSFKSVTEFVVQVLHEVAAPETALSTVTSNSLEVEIVRARLRALGYID